MTVVLHTDAGSETVSRSPRVQPQGLPCAILVLYRLFVPEHSEKSLTDEWTAPSVAGDAGYRRANASLEFVYRPFLCDSPCERSLSPPRCLTMESFFRKTPEKELTYLRGQSILPFAKCKGHLASEDLQVWCAVGRCIVEPRYVAGQIGWLCSIAHCSLSPLGVRDRFCFRVFLGTQ